VDEWVGWDGWIDGWIDGTVGQTDRQTDRQIDKEMDGWMNKLYSLEKFCGCALRNLLIVAGEKCIDASSARGCHYEEYCRLGCGAM
jgi:hypothetical protein